MAHSDTRPTENDGSEKKQKSEDPKHDPKAKPTSPKAPERSKAADDPNYDPFDDGNFPL